MNDPFSDIQRSIEQLQPTLRLPDFDFSRITSASEQIAAASHASDVCARLKSVIDRFIATLDPTMEVGLALTSFGVAHVISVTQFQALGPTLLIIEGIENGCPVTLVQHVSQLNFLLIPVRPADSAAPPRRTIGFRTE